MQIFLQNTAVQRRKKKSEKLVLCSPTFGKRKEIMHQDLQEDVTFDTA